MAIFNSLKEVLIRKSVNFDRPIFYKSDSDARYQLEQLKELYKSATSHVKSQIDQDIRMLAYGIAGEENVAFELNNSYLPIIVLHDLHIEFDGLTAQIDYLIITTKFNLIIECKNLIGNIEVNNNGDFIRTTEYKGKYKKEGIYSPITQLTRHLEMIKKVRATSKNNILTKKLFEKNFDNNYKSVVVLANPKTVINMRYAKKEVKERIIRCDQLIEYIKKLLKDSRQEPYTEKEMYELADFFLSFHTPNAVDYTKKYHLGDLEKRESEPQAAVINLEDTPLYKALKQYRYETSKAEGLKPYFIYNNAQMENLIKARPRSLQDIKKIPGFGEVKCEKYGNAILEMIKKHS